MPYKDPEKQREAQRRYEEKNRKGKQRTIWWAYLYEDSAPENFLDLMRESGMEGLAMKHDRDVTAAGEVKEAHWHVVVRFSHAVQAKEAKKFLLPSVARKQVCSTAIAGRLLRVTCATWTIRTRRNTTPPMLSNLVAPTILLLSIARQTNIASSRRCATGRRRTASTASTSLLITPAPMSLSGLWHSDNCAIFMREYLKSYRYDLLSGEEE